MASTAHPRQATLYRMVMDKHVCPYGLKAKDLLRRQGFTVEDKWLTTREATDAFKAEHGVKTTPQTFINGERIGGYDDLRRYFGKAANDPKAATYKPVVALFGMTALMALAASHAAYGTPFTLRRGRVVHRLQHGRSGAPEASERRELRHHVPGL